MKPNKSTTTKPQATTPTPVPTPTVTDGNPWDADLANLDRHFSAAVLRINELEKTVKALTTDVNEFADQVGPAPLGYASVVMDADSRIYPVRVKDVDGNGFTSKIEAVAAAREWIEAHNMSASYRAGVIEIF